MKAAVVDKYGPADVIEVCEIARPEPADGEVLVQVMASAVSPADWRMRSADFPKGLALVGRLMAGVFRPRNRVLGADFSGRIVGVGDGVTGWKMGDKVVGFAGDFGAHAEYLTQKADGCIAPLPDDLSYEEAAALPFAALCALEFLRDVAKVQPGQKVLITGASGGTGIYAVQIAKILGAEVTGLCSGRNADLVRSHGVDRVIDYTRENVLKVAGGFDLVFDTAGILSFGQAKKILKRDGLFLPLEFGAGEAFAALGAKLFGGPRIVLHINGDTAELLQAVLGYTLDGKLKPVIDSQFPLARIADAHRRVEGRHRTGSVIVNIAQPECLTDARAA